MRFLLSSIELLIVLVTAIITTATRLTILVLLVLLAYSVTNHNFHMVKVPCGTYITDSTRGWVEIYNSNDNSRIATITIDCANNAIESVVMK